MISYLDEDSIADLTIGSTILGAGGGGDPYVGSLLARELIRSHGPVAMVDLEDVPDDARVVFIAGMGAPGVLIEKLPRASEVSAALDALERYLGEKFTHVSPIEAGGLNALMPVPVAAERGLPLVDADGMGRAFPSLELCTPTLHGASCTPMAMVDEHGNTLVVESPTNLWAEQICRAATVASGCVTMMALYPMNGELAKRSLVRGVLSVALALGRTLREARAAGLSPVDAIVERQGGARLFEGRVVAVDRRNERGWTMGSAEMAGTDAFAGSKLVLQFQNEHLVAIRDGAVVATVPDLIMVLSSDSGEPVPAEEIRYGYRVSVIGLPCDAQWRTEAGLAIAGPRRFGYETDYVPVEQSA